MHVTDSAKVYIARGWSVVPIPHGEKGPKIPDWPNLKLKEDEVDHFFRSSTNIGIILGQASGGLVCIDLDHEIARELAQLWLPPTPLVVGRPGSQRSHWFYKVTEPVKSQKRKLTAGDGKLSICELLSDGNQVVVGPSVHPSGDVYDMLDAEPATIDSEKLLSRFQGLYLAVLAELGIEPPEEKKATEHFGSERTTYLKPGEDYDDRGDVRALLIKHGWKPIFEKKGNEYWRRPGKEDGISASLRGRQFYVFTSSAAHLQADQCYGPFGLYAALECGGDFPAAHDRLREEGFGSNDDDVDISFILNQRPVLLDAEGKIFDEACPMDIAKSETFLGRLIRFNLETAAYPQPELALGGAIALTAAIVGNKVKSFCKYETHPNLYILSLALTGAGKDHARKLNRKLLNAAGVPQYLGNEMINSSRGIMGRIEQHPIRLFQIDEIADLLTTMNSSGRVAPYLATVSPLLKQLYSSSGQVFNWAALAGDEEDQVIAFPYCVIYGTTVVQGFWDSITPNQITDGLLSRFSIFESPGYVRIASPKYRDLPADLIEFVKYWTGLGTGGGDLEDVTPQAEFVPHSEEAYKRASTHSEQINERQIEEAKTDPYRAALWSRTAEKTNKLALLLACSRCDVGQWPRVEIEDVNQAIALSNWLTRRTLAMMKKHTSESEWEKLVKRAKEKLVNGMTMRNAKRAVKFLRPDQQRALWQQLTECEEIVIETIQTGGRSSQILHCSW